MTGKGEIPIEKMTGFHPPDDDEHEYILQNLRKKLKREKISSCLWIFLSLAFVGLYIHLIVNSKTTNKMYLILSAIVFAVIAVVCIYKMLVIDVRIRSVIENKDYQTKNVHIHHLMPNIGISLGKAVAKVNDDDQNVYRYEFDLNKRLKKIYKKNKNATFTMMEASLRGKNKRQYILTYIPPKEENTEEKEEEKE